MKDVRGTVNICKAVLFTPERSCCKSMTHFPSSLYFSFSICISAFPISEVIYISAANYAYRFLSCFWCISPPLTLTFSHQHAQWVTVQIIAAFIGTKCNPGLLTWEFPRAPMAEQVADRFRHVWWFSRVCHKRG